MVWTKPKVHASFYLSFWLFDCDGSLMLVAPFVLQAQWSIFHDVSLGYFLLHTPVLQREAHAIQPHCRWQHAGDMLVISASSSIASRRPLLGS